VVGLAGRLFGAEFARAVRVAAPTGFCEVPAMPEPACMHPGQ